MLPTRYVGLVAAVVCAAVYVSSAALGEACTSDADCTGVTHAACDTSNDQCGCIGAYKSDDSTTCTAKVLGDACAADTDCVGVTNAACDTSNNQCACIGAFKSDDSTTCTAKGNGDTCSADSDCVAVTNSACESDNTCGCADGYKISTSTCSAVLGKACASDSAAADCTDHVKNAACTNGVCSCVAGYLKSGAICSTGSTVLLQACANNAACQNGGDAHAVCAKNGEKGGDPDGNCICNGTYKEKDDACVVKAVSEIECDPADTDVTTGGAAVCKSVDAYSNCPVGTTKCACNNGYKQDKTNVNTCVKVLGGTCSDTSGCTGVVNSECSTTSSKCVCVTDYIEDSSNICKKALGQTCTNAEECVTNAECATTCKCSSGYINTGGHCALPSTASSVWMTTSVVLSSPLIYVLRLIH